MLQVDTLGSQSDTDLSHPPKRLLSDPLLPRPLLAPPVVTAHLNGVSGEPGQSVLCSAEVVERD